MSVSIVPLVAPAGANIRGVDLSREISREDFEKIDAAYSEYGVVFFSGQDLTPSQHVAFSRRFGDLENLREITPKVHPDFNEIIILSNIVENGVQIGVVDAGQYWHTDVQFLEKPSRGSLLHAIEVPVDETGLTLGDTKFANQASAYEGLSEAMKKTVSSLKALNSYKERYVLQSTNRQKEEGEKLPEKGVEAVHPVVRTHPVTGRKCLYVSEGYTKAIVGMPEDEGRDLLKELLQHATKDEYVYVHKWQRGDLLLWDNCIMQHNAVGNYAKEQRRLMHRATLKGDRPF